MLLAKLLSACPEMHLWRGGAAQAAHRLQPANPPAPPAPVGDLEVKQAAIAKVR
jgi:hypothetical protein